MVMEDMLAGEPPPGIENDGRAQIRLAAEASGGLAQDHDQQNLAIVWREAEAAGRLDQV